jgi:D-glycero-D-manno-heptose 1,7-bisphosphate phosphatase
VGVYTSEFWPLGIIMSFIILDRDGVINYDSDEYIKSPEEWNAIPGSLDAIAELNRVGFRVFIVTNQSGVARGYFDLHTLSLIHEKLIRELSKVGGSVEEIFFCPHHPDENCLCRKPKPGLLHQIASNYPINFSDTFFIGDSWRDVVAARSVGCHPILVRTGNGDYTLKAYPELTSIPNFKDLAGATEYVLSRSAHNTETLG